MKPEKTESQKIGDELAEEKETYGLYDKVKLDVYDIMTDTNNFLYDINDRDLPEGKKEIQYMKNGSRFVASIIKLHMLLMPKLSYAKREKDEPDYPKLKELDDYYFERNGKQIGKMTFREAKEYFYLQRAFIEKLGITRFEIEKLASKEKIMRDAFSSD